MPPVEAAALIDGPEADGLLIRALSDPDPSVAHKAVCSLGWRRCRDADTALARLYPDAAPDLRRDIATALSWIGSPLGPTYKGLWEPEAGPTPVLCREWDGWISRILRHRGSHQTFRLGFCSPYGEGRRRQA